LKQALIVWGGWAGHEPKQCADVVAGLLNAEGFKVQVADSTAAFGDPALGRFDLIVPIITQSAITPEACHAAAGTGEDQNRPLGMPDGIALDATEFVNLNSH
jgi:type 1 glutamine amidotransferase